MAIEKWLHTVAKTGNYNDLLSKPKVTSEISIDDETVLASAKSVKKLNDTINTKANSSHTHTKSQITDMPTSLKNPTTLTVQFNGTTNKTYDGSTAQTVNIIPSSIGASASNHTHNYAGSSSAGGAATTALACTGTSANSSKLGGTFTASDTPSTTEKTNLVGMINEVFQSASNGKSSIATAITSKGVSASSGDTFESLSNKIKQITTGVDTSDATAISSGILTGQTAYVKGSKIIGTMANNGAINAALNAGQSTTISKGYTDGGTITANSLASQTQATAQAGYILSGQSAWVNGNLVNGNVPNLTGIRDATGVARWGDNGLAVYPERGYQKGGPGDGEIKVSQAQVINTFGISANKIVSGQEVAGVWGNVTVEGLGGRKFASGTVNAIKDTSISSAKWYISISLPFTPSVFIASNGNGMAYVIYNTFTGQNIYRGSTNNGLTLSNWSGYDKISVSSGIPNISNTTLTWWAIS